MNNNETLTIPTGTNREDIKERERIISDVYRRWYEANGVFGNHCDGVSVGWNRNC